MINTLISTLTVIVPLVIAYVKEKRTKEESNFYSYITLSEEKYVKKTRIKGNVFWCIIILLYLVILFNNSFYFLPLSTESSFQILVAVQIELPAFTIMQAFCNTYLVFSKNKYLDKRLKIVKRDVSHLDSWISSIALIVIGVLVIFVIICLIVCDKERGKAIVVGALIFSLGTEAVLNSYVSLYVKVRRWYFIERITIRTKTNECEYNSIFNYRKDSATYSFVYEEGKKLKRMKVPIDEVVAIESFINTGTTFLDNWIKEDK